MEKRTITGLLASAYVIAMVLLGKTALLINIALLLVVGTYEVLQSLSAGGFHPVKWVYYPYVLLLVPAYLWGGDRGLLLMLMIGAMTAMAAMLASGFRKDRNPTTASKMPRAVNQPHPRTPKRCKSNELTNLVMPEKISHMPKTTGSVSTVNHWLHRINNDKRTVRMPSTKNQPTPAI